MALLSSFSDIGACGEMIWVRAVDGGCLSVRGSLDTSV